MINDLRRNFYLYLTFLFLFSFFVPSYADPEGATIFRTSYCDISYPQGSALSGFLWRISGKKFDLTGDMNLARSRVDALVDRVQSILDMYPRMFRIKIDLRPEYESGMVASYDYKTDKITVYADRVTDGVLAHEIAHAVICNYFEIRPPSKIQEMLAQYVDQHLWEDY